MRQHFVVGDAGGPGTEVAALAEILVFAPHYQIRGLEHVVGVVSVGQQLENVGVQTPLGVSQMLNKLQVVVRGRSHEPDSPDNKVADEAMCLPSIVITAQGNVL